MSLDSHGLILVSIRAFTLLGELSMVVKIWRYGAMVLAHKIANNKFCIYFFTKID